MLMKFNDMPIGARFLSYGQQPGEGWASEWEKVADSNTKRNCVAVNRKGGVFRDGDFSYAPENLEYWVLGPAEPVIE